MRGAVASHNMQVHEPTINGGKVISWWFVIVSLTNFRGLTEARYRSPVMIV
jgi:hypothetical protein